MVGPCNHPITTTANMETTSFSGSPLLYKPKWKLSETQVPKVILIESFCWFRDPHNQDPGTFLQGSQRPSNICRSFTLLMHHYRLVHTSLTFVVSSTRSEWLWLILSSYDSGCRHEKNTCGQNRGLPMNQSIIQKNNVSFRPGNRWLWAVAM